MNTRIGPYVFDVDLDSMEIEQLECLKAGCEQYIMQRKADKLMADFLELNRRARAEGFFFGCSEPFYDGTTSVILDAFNVNVFPEEKDEEE